MPQRVRNKFGVDISVGDALLIKEDRLGTKMLANVEKGEVVIVTSISENGKILYHHNSLALPADCSFFDVISCAISH